MNVTLKQHSWPPPALVGTSHRAHPPAQGHLLPPLELPDEVAYAGRLAPWHRKRPDVVVSVLALQRRVASHLNTLAEYILPRMPQRVLASQTIRAVNSYHASAPAFLGEAITLPWMALDSDVAANAIVIDIDHAEGPDKVAQLKSVYGLPRPTLVIDPWSGRSHLIVMLQTPVLMNANGRAGPQKLWGYAARLLAAAVGGTPMPYQSLVKSPWGRTENLIGKRLRRDPSPAVPLLWDTYLAADTGLMWHTEPGDLPEYELRDIVAALADEFGTIAAGPGARKRFGRSRAEPSALGRNCALFDLLRFWAYDTAEADEHHIATEAERINRGFPIPLGKRELASTTRSVARFMAHRFDPRTGINSRRGRDRLAGAGLTPHGRQVLSGQVTAAGRAAATDDRIRITTAALQAAGKPITQGTVAAASGLSLRTVKRHWQASLRVPDDAWS
jgi:hypothetical protein